MYANWSKVKRNKDKSHNDVNNLIDIITSMSINYGDFAYGYELSDVYPNPFNPSTTINFTVSESIDLSLVIYDMKGRVVDTLVNGNLAPGVYSINWNARDESSGIYFVQMISGEFMKTQKLMLLK